MKKSLLLMMVAVLALLNVSCSDNSVDEKYIGSWSIIESVISKDGKPVNTISYPIGTYVITFKENSYQELLQAENNTILLEGKCEQSGNKLKIEIDTASQGSEEFIGMKTALEFLKIENKTINGEIAEVAQILNRQEGLEETMTAIKVIENN